MSARHALDAGALATAMAGAARARDLAEGDAWIVADALELEVEAAALAGDTDRATRVGAHLLGALTEVGAAPERRAAAHVRLARAAATAADWSGARDHVDTARRLAAGPEREAAVQGMAYGLAHLASEDRQRARTELADAVALVPTHSDIGRSHLWGLHLLAHLGGERLEPPAPARLNRINAGCLELDDAVALGAAGDRDGAQAAFARGDALLAPAPWLRQLAHRLVAEHAVAHGWGAPVEWLREAATFFTASGNDALATACRSLLRKAGVPVARRGRGEQTVTGPLAASGVTSRELDVLALVAEGLSNRDIGARLYLSPRTVEKHVERLLAKTGSTSRARLAALAARTAP